MGSGLGVATYGHAPFSERERGHVPKAYIYARRGRWVEHICASRPLGRAYIYARRVKRVKCCFEKHI